MSKIEQAVIEKINARAKLGLKKYNSTMERADLSRLEWLNHAQEESMDLCLYLQKLIEGEENRENKQVTLDESISEIEQQEEKKKMAAMIYAESFEAQKRLRTIGQNGNDGTHYTPEDAEYLYNIERDKQNYRED